MARMYPSHLTKEPQHGELQVYQQLQQMPDDWVAILNHREHSKRNNNYANYEADFIVLIPGLGIVVIEVKDWPFVRLHHGEWQGKAKEEDEVWTGLGYKQSPLNQAFLCSRKVIQGLVHRGILPEDSRQQPEIRSLAILTNAVPPDLCENTSEEDKSISHKTHVPLESLYLCGREALENHLKERIESLFVYRRRKGRLMTEALVRELEEYFAPNLLFRMDFSNYTETMANAAPDLFRLLPSLEESRGGIRVEGCAGSGKTEMALREVRRLAALLPPESDKSILLLCYNNALAYRLRRGIRGCRGAAHIIIAGFHDYCIEHIIRPAGRDDLILYDEQTPYLDDAGWEWVASGKAALPRHDYIFVDEAQDFKPIWWDIIRSILPPGGKLYLFADTRQDIYHRCHELPDLPTRVRLTRNLRNAWRIATFSHGILPTLLSMSPSLYSGAPLRLRAASDSPEERANEVRRAIEELKNHPEHHIRNSDIVVLSPWRASNQRCSFPFCPELDYADATENAQETAARHERCRRHDSPRILADTIKGFKGLEAPFVILTDIPAPDEYRGFTAADFYVACTRARFGLFIIPTLSGNITVARILEQTASHRHPDETDATRYNSRY